MEMSLNREGVIGVKTLKFEAYDHEWQQALNKIEETGYNYPSLRYFLDLAKSYKDAVIMTKMPKVIMVGTQFPEEILLALDEQTVWLLGGIFTTTAWSEQKVPRDTDSVTKSILGLLLNEAITLTKDTMILLPITCDSMRKLVNMLSRDFNIVPIEMPSNKSSTLYQKHWCEEVRHVTHRLERHLKKRLKAKHLADKVHQVNRAKEAVGHFNTVCKERQIPGSLNLFIMNSYYWENDKVLWAQRVEDLANEIANGPKKHQETIDVALMGSPIYYPNYKIPHLLEELGLNLQIAINPLSQNLKSLLAQSSAKLHPLIEALALALLAQDISPAYVSNKTLYDQVVQLVETSHLNGVVYHVLKGHIEYDFEFRKIEAYLEKQGIPIFRLETDYHYQDIGQLSIRLEAFCEMLIHRKMTSEKGA